MTRGVFVGRCFVVINSVLAITLIVIAVVLAMQTYSWHVAENEDTGGESNAEGGPVAQASVLRDRAAYDVIQASGLFGDAGRIRVVPVPTVLDEAPTPGEAPIETALNLRLWAVTSLSPESPFGAASIETIGQDGSRRLFHVLDQVAANVTLEAIHPRWVLLRNDGVSPARFERLSMDEDKEAFATADRRPTVLPAERVALNRRDLVQTLYQDYQGLISTVKPELYRNQGGAVEGITAQGIGEVPLAQQLGLQEGDVLQTVNNERIDSQQKVLEMFQKYQNSNNFSIGILRNGKPKQITYSLE